MSNQDTKSDIKSDTKITSYPKHKIKILLLENISKTAADIFVNEGFQVECYPKLTETELLEKIKDVHALGVRSKTLVNKKVLESAKKLLTVGCFCIGTDQTDLDFAASRGVCVFNAPFANTRSVAELILAEVIILARQAGDRNMEMHKKIWNKNSNNCYEVRGKTIGIVGYGHVGTQLSILAEAVGMQVYYHDIIPKLPLGNAKAVQSLKQLLPMCDFVSLHVPLANDTINLIGEKEIALMRKGSYLLNASRGVVVDVNAAAEAIKSGHLAGAAFDVFPDEPAGKGDEFKSPLIGLPNTFLTPHVGGSTEEAQAAIGVEVAKKMCDFINLGVTLGSVNLPEINLPLKPNCHRILNVHQNVPGVLKSINEALSGYNVESQVLMTKGSVGYLIVEVDHEVSRDVKQKIQEMKTSIRTRILY